MLRALVLCTLRQHGEANSAVWCALCASTERQTVRCGVHFAPAQRCKQCACDVHFAPAQRGKQYACDVHFAPARRGKQCGVVCTLRQHREANSALVMCTLRQHREANSALVMCTLRQHGEANSAVWWAPFALLGCKVALAAHALHCARTLALRAPTSPASVHWGSRTTLCNADAGCWTPALRRAASLSSRRGHGMNYGRVQRARGCPLLQQQQQARRLVL